MKKAELLEVAKELAEELDLSTEALGLDKDPTHKELENLVSDLKAKAKDAKRKSAADEAAENKEESIKEEAAKIVEKGGLFAVVKGKSVCGTKKGIIGEFGKIAADDLGGGEVAIARLISLGVVERVKG